MRSKSIIGYCGYRTTKAVQWWNEDPTFGVIPFFIPPPPKEYFLKFHTPRNFTSRCSLRIFKSVGILGLQTPRNITFVAEPPWICSLQILRPFGFSLPLSHKEKQPLGFSLTILICEPLGINLLFAGTDKNGMTLGVQPLPGEDKILTSACSVQFLTVVWVIPFSSVPPPPRRTS